MTVAKSSIPFVCEECGGEFEPQFGGICRSCGRLLCHKHLIDWGSLPVFRKKEEKAQPICKKCKKEKGPKKWYEQRII